MKKNILISVALLSILGCSNSSDDLIPAPVIADHYGPSSIPVAVSAELRLSSMGQEVKTDNRLSVSRDTEVDGSRVKMQYNFNSKENTGLKIISLSVTQSNCQQIKYGIFLTAKGVDQEINVIQGVPLTPNTDYKVEVRFSSYNSCAIESNLAAVAYDMATAVSPEVVTACEDIAKGRTYEFFRNTLPATLYYTNSENEKVAYFGENIIFGLKQDDKDIVSKKLVKELNGDIESQVFSAMHKDGYEVRNCRLDYSKHAKNLNASCENAVEKLSLKDCKDLVADKNNYKNNMVE